ncbi:MAG: dipeptide epimerase [Chitinophagales bacterium]
MRLEVELQSVQWQFRYPFRIAHGMRTHTDAVVLKLSRGGHSGYGEATLPPYLPDTQQSTFAFLEQLPYNKCEGAIQPGQWVQLLTANSQGFFPAKAALDMALWQLKAAEEHTTIRNLLGITTPDTAWRSFTISICDRYEMKDRLQFGHEQGFDFFKLKLNGTSDRQMLNDFRSLSNAPFAVDVNQGWNNLQKAIEFSNELKAAGAVLIEQPFTKTDREWSRRLRDVVGLPVIADEACQQLTDLTEIAGYFSGVNIKLQKCGGLTQAFEMLKVARPLGLKVLIGCMSESHIGCDAAATLSPWCDWNDLDGPFLITNNP